MMVFRLIVGAVLAAAAAIIFLSLPDMARYRKMRGM